MIYLGIACLFAPPLALMIFAAEMSYRRQKRHLDAAEQIVDSMMGDIQLILKDLKKDSKEIAKP